ncbi:MAG: hypothetical protein QMD14_04965 [Candidatus Aenigmarchaeota archaeon]|nr:hypothetical protein [Candidatus Aenigmarchaeota archaeon]
MLFKPSHGVILYCDVELDDFKRIMNYTTTIEGVSGYLIDRLLEARYGFPAIRDARRNYTDLPLVFEAQREGNASEAKERDLIKLYAANEVDALVLFSYISPRIQKACVDACYENKLTPIAGFKLPQLLTAEDEISIEDERLKGESYRGYIAKDALERALGLYAKLGVDHYLVSGNEVDELKHTKDILLEMEIKPIFCMPNLGIQEGDIAQAFEAVKDCPAAYGIITPRKEEIEDKWELKERIKRLADEALRF